VREFGVSETKNGHARWRRLICRDASCLRLDMAVTGSCPSKGQGRIKIEATVVERLKELMRVRPQPARRRQPPMPRHHYPGITVELGRPDA